MPSAVSELSFEYILSFIEMVTKVRIIGEPSKGASSVFSIRNPSLIS